MTQKITISVLGEKYWLYVYITYSSKHCIVRLFGKDEELSATFDETHITLDLPISLLGKDYKTSKVISKIRIPKDLVYCFKECLIN